MDKTIVLSGGEAGFGNGSSNKPRPLICDHFDKGSISIDDSVLLSTHPDIRGMHPCIVFLSV
eukprot:SAG31_NODE_37578_length_303_cov_0.745098_1_plen_61_part_01